MTHMTETMIERVAQALKDAGLREDHDVRLALARAAIQAMREPTWEMTFTAYGNPMPPVDVWKYMIEGALGERGK